MTHMSDFLVVLFKDIQGLIQNIQNVAYDLKSRERCSFITMLMLQQIMMKDLPGCLRCCWICQRS
ncbi:hypothetical protein M378DRAFT_172577 [Amanita muscaria Koide BX008]|uniref:Uncharacterized protein n=1 Tax=Amanita muscaria (strain Koide BX008) TaxID=946122 RepID=A0A0C2S1S7_AMAMK|nr:hypothetical protein M378DRAFT_172577 [Amanita muscaria Koide BX008]